jgi:hypothetical protein
MDWRPTVAYQLDLYPDRGMVLVRHSGVMTVDQIMAPQAELTALLQEEAYRRMVVDIRNTTRPHHFFTMAYFTVTIEIARLFRGFARVAVIYNPEEWSSRDMQFSEMVASNRGLSLRTFHTEDEAIAWAMT